MGILASVGRIVVLFIEVFCVSMTMLLMIGAMMETTYAAIGFTAALVGLVYAYMQRDKQDLIDRYFYYILGVLVTYAIAFLATK